ncbi:sialate O-acetylesterase [Arenibacter algicola]|uniref:Carbohydrate acetyl esterase/feruloyl esterase n=1 Tax=Arenibacter algicola TaxID=616991 RepID=A0A221V1U7_9FLAO|nr:sialate O-acetylesterase [Arenibacter algicola]ASO07567.1 carbohydrate acetyl esterase/feruloyl esterase [Arenibacter algicola]
MINRVFQLTIVLFSMLSLSYGQDTNERTQFFPKVELSVENIPNKENLWVFILAGQSNMAGRGLVEPQDTVPNNRVYTLNKQGNIIFAKEPLHFYEPTMAGLDSGLSFGKALIKHIPDSISVLLIPTAVGGSSISQWLNDSIHREVKLFSNFKQKAELGMRFGTVKGILWHQGESDAKTKEAPLYQIKLSELFYQFRKIIGNQETTVVIGQLGSYSTNPLWSKINDHIKYYVSTDQYSGMINTQDLKDKGDKVHFNSEAQRLMGERFANEFIKLQH